MRSEWGETEVRDQIQALVYDILLPITAITDYAKSLQKLSTNRQFFAGAQIEVTT